MMYSDIKEGHIYYVNLEEVREFEFGKDHLSIVLRKGQDKKTLIIIPLTSKSSGMGKNKVGLGRLTNLPRRLNTDDYGKPTNTYAVLDQIRTVSAGRFTEIKNGKNTNGTDIILECAIDPTLFTYVVCEVTNYQIANLKDNDAIGKYHQESYSNYCVKKIIDLTYSLLRATDDISDEKEQIRYFHANVVAINKNFSISDYLTNNDKRNKIDEKVNDIILEVAK